MKTALHSVSYAGVWPGQTALPVERVIEKAAEFGYDGVMLMAKRPHASPLDLDEAGRRRLREAIEARGLTHACLAAYTDFGVESPGIPFREMQVLYVIELARLARDLGTCMVRIFTAFERPGAGYRDAWAGCVGALKEAARRAADLGVTLAVQNHHDLAVHHDAMFDLLSDVDEPNCRAAFDAWAPALHGVDLAASVRKMAPFIVHTTVADYQPRPRYTFHSPLSNYSPAPAAMRAVPVGEGIIDYPAFFAALREIGYDGVVAYEMCEMLTGGGSEANMDRCARHFIDWFRKEVPGGGPRR
jgi:sugar phosphate isomerase/epimerase